MDNFNGNNLNNNNNFNNYNNGNNNSNMYNNQYENTSNQMNNMNINNTQQGNVNGNNQINNINANTNTTNNNIYSHSNNQMNTGPQNSEQPYKVISDRQLKGLKFGSKVVGVLTFLIFIITGYIIFYMYRMDKYEFYLNKKEILLANNSSYQIELTPKNADIFDYNNYKYKSFNENIAIVDETGKITAIGVGETEIEIKYKNGISGKKIIVKTEDIGSVEIKSKYDEGQIETEVEGREDLNIDVTYRVDNPEAIEVDPFGHVESPSGKGGTVVVTPPEGTPVEVTVPSEPAQIEVQSVEFVENSISLKQGGKGKVTAIVKPENASNKGITYTSDNGNVVVDNEGNITGVSVGSSVITATSSNGKIAYCNVSVINDVISVTAIDLNPTEIKITTGESKELSAKFVPSDATERELVWESSNSNIVSVINGKITGVSVGEATVTVKTKDGKVSNSCQVIVNPSVIPVTELKIKK